jgi:uncharacterized membrane protein YuzA (DUF378 family)
MHFLNLIATLLAVVGSVNWGLVAIANVDLVKVICGDKTPLAKAVYSAVGLSGLILLYSTLTGGM